MNRIDTETLQTWQRECRDFMLIDTLSATHFTAGHLPGAINILSDDTLEQAPRKLTDLNATTVVYCAGTQCKRAALSGQRLERLGYTRVLHYAGGKKSWVAAGLPLVRVD